jgi:hypothetical protein
MLNTLQVASLVQKLKRAVEGKSKMEVEYTDLTAIMDQDSVAIWMGEAREAEVQRGEYLKIYDLDVSKGKVVVL